MKCANSRTVILYLFVILLYSANHQPMQNHSAGVALYRDAADITPGTTITRRRIEPAYGGFNAAPSVRSFTPKCSTFDFSPIHIELSPKRPVRGIIRHVCEVSTATNTERRPALAFGFIASGDAT